MDTGNAANATETTRQVTPAVIFRALRWSVAITVLFAAALWMRLGWRWAGEFAFFSLWSVCNLYLLARTVLLVSQRGSKLRIVAGALGLAGLMAVLLAFFALARPSGLAFALGFHLPYVVIILALPGRRGGGPRDLQARAPFESTL